MTSVDARGHFDEAHQARSDPWGVTSRWYEERKRALVLASLPDRHYASALEVGCSIGVLTAELAARSDRVLGVDFSREAVARASARLEGLPGASAREGDAVDDFPDETFDLIVVSEVAYYLTPARLDRLIDLVTKALTPGGTLVLCHWRYPEGDFEQSGDRVHRRVRAILPWTVVVEHVEADFLLDVLSPDARSVAARTGLV